MDRFVLILYTRVGCCLCEGLENRLSEISIANLHPNLKLSVKDIDGDEVSDIDRACYNYKVPVLILACVTSNQMIQLPRVSPRLRNEELFKWLEKVIKENIKKI